MRVQFPPNAPLLNNTQGSTFGVSTSSQVEVLGKFYRSLGKSTYGLCDKQAEPNKLAITGAVDELFMHEEHGFEDLVLKNTTTVAVERFCDLLEWPQHLQQKYPTPKANAMPALKEYFLWAK